MFRQLLASVGIVAVSALSCTSRPSGYGPSPQATQRPATPFKPYQQVITPDAVFDGGLFAVQMVGTRLHFEIPDSLLGRDMLLISRIAQAPADLGAFASAGSKVAEQVVRWERNGNRVLLRTVSYRNVADDTLAVHRSVQVNNFAPIVAAFDIVAFNPGDSSLVVEVNDLFESDVRAISGLSQSSRDRFNVRRLDGDRTFIDYARSYPLSVCRTSTLSG